MHGSSSNRLEVINVLEMLLMAKYVVVSFDFSGCGWSQGKYVTYGYKEVSDVSTVVNYIRNTKRIREIYL